jgi:hypothetical protein
LVLRLEIKNNIILGGKATTLVIFSLEGVDNEHDMVEAAIPRLLFLKCWA